MSKIFLSVSILIIFLFNQIINLNANDDAYINSKNIIYNEKENIVELSENSKINLNNTNILIDKGIIDYNKNEFEVFGNFYLYEGLNILSGKNLKGNTSLNIFTANNVSFLYNDNLKIDADNLSRESNLVYFYNNFLTPCELNGYFNCPTWSLRIDKTEYNVERDKFNHYNTFLQIADKKVFYLPYFSHYGQKAPRQKGFLTPTIEFTLGGSQNIKTPYYIPINRSSDITLTPTFFFDKNFEFLENYNLNADYEKKTSGGETTINVSNSKTYRSEYINSSLKIKTKQVLNKNKIFSASGIFTNSISTTRSNNSEPITFDDLYVQFENYNFFHNDDYLKSEISTIKTFDATNINLIPISPKIKYHNKLQIKDDLILNDLNFTILKRAESNNNAASEGLRIDVSNEIIKNNFFNNLAIFNKVTLSNSYSDYRYYNDPNLNSDSYKSSLIYSSNFFYNLTNQISPRLKFVLPLELKNTNKTVNEDSRSLTSNYYNSFSDNRIFGNDLSDNSPRMVYGIENNFNIIDNKISIFFNQTYDFNKNNNYTNRLNQKSNFSDYNLLAKTKYKDVSFQLDARIDQKNISKKEMNYKFSLIEPLELDILYNETKADSFKDLSGDSKSIEFSMGKKISDNFKVKYNSNIDLQNDYSPFKSTLSLIFEDECSNLEISYSNSRFNDNFNTQPSETISFQFYMDYLGFFGYQQSTDLLFKEAGTFDYGQ